jgi:hypothetical protein
MEDAPKEGLLDQLQALMRDALDYLSKTLELQQARLTALLLTGILFTFQILVAFCLGAAAFILFNVGIGLALAHYLGSSLWAVVILGLMYAIFSVLLSYKALKWLSNLKS